jgi:glycosyltransferase involved in cell wall biosynthesis
MTTPRISVLLPCFNDGQWIDEALASVWQQTFQDFEIVIVDDGSTDAATVRKLDLIDAPGTQVLRTENRGLPAARNHAAAHARGELFCALDADDRLSATWFEKGNALLESRPDVAFVSHWLETFGDEHWTWKPVQCDLPALLARNTINGAALVTRSAFEAVGGYDESMRHGCEDWDFWLRLVEAGYPGAIIPEVLFYYRRHAASMSRGMTTASSYRKPLQTLLDKHAQPYRDHLLSVMVSKEAERLGLADEIAALERERLNVLDPALERAAEELRALRVRESRVRAEQLAREERDRLVHQVGELNREVAALRTSWSWRITGPLRWLYSRLSGGGA